MFENNENWKISSQASWQQVEGSTTNVWSPPLWMVKRHERGTIKLCRVCDEYSLETNFNKGTNRCKPCGLKYQQAWRLANPDIRRQQRIREYEVHGEKLKAYSAEYRKQNPEKVKEAVNKWLNENVEYRQEYRRDRYANNSEFRNKLKAHNSTRHARLRQSMPEWAKPYVKKLFEIAQELTDTTGIQMHVDHIIPLQGKFVSGLTVPLNLQILPAGQNASKGNSFSIDDIV